MKTSSKQHSIIDDSGIEMPLQSKEGSSGKYKKENTLRSPEEIDENPDEITIDDIINLIPFGKFQSILAIVFVCNFVTNSFYSYNYSYILLIPQYECLNKETGLYESCENDYVCNTLVPSNDSNWRVDWADHLSINNWIEQLGLHCLDPYEIGLFGTMEFIGCSLACIIFTPMADVYGRRPFTKWSMWFSLLVPLISVFTRNRYFFYGNIFINGVLIAIKQFIVYSHVFEFMSVKTNLISGIYFFFDGSIFTISPLLILFVWKNTQILVYCALFLAVVTQLAVLTFFKIPESLKFSLSQGNIKQFEQDAQYIFDMNKVPQDIQERVHLCVKQYLEQERTRKKVVHDDENIVLQELEKVGIIKTLITTKNAIYNMIMTTMGWFGLTFIFFLLDFFVKYLPGDIYVNQLFASLSMFGYIIAEPIAKVTSNKFTLLISLFVSMIAILVMFCFHHLNPYVFATVFLILKGSICTAFSAIYVIHNEIFPTQLLASSYGITNFVARLLTLFAPLLAEVHNRAVPYFFMIGINALSIVATGLIRVKNNKTI